MEDLLNDLEISDTFAPLGKRWLAAFIDYFIFLIILFIIMNALGTFATDDNEGGAVLLSFCSIFLTWLVLYPGMESFNNGKTIGKSICSIRVVNKDGSKIKFWKALVRHLFDIVDNFPTLGILGVMVASNNSNKQRVGDLVAKTTVVLIKKGQPGQLV